MGVDRNQVKQSRFIVSTKDAGVVELEDTPDLGSGSLWLWGFKSLHPHHVTPSRSWWRTSSANGSSAFTVGRVMAPDIDISRRPKDSFH